MNEYALGHLADAFATATTHSDTATRERAEARVRQWVEVLRGMSDGTLRIGSRTPVADLPAWVTPEVVRGGFATGRASAGGPLLPHETDRLTDFARALTPEGQAELCTLLDSGEYRADLPEEAALLVPAWLVRQEDFDAAEALLGEIGPFADRLRFLPTPDPTKPNGLLWRQTVGDASATLARRAPNPRVAAMNEALTVWNPFADELLELWLDSYEDIRIGARIDAAWRARAEALVARYAELSATHTLTTKHRNPRHNLAVLFRCTAMFVRREAIGLRDRRLLEHTIEAMVAKRGRPGSPRHTALRAAQSAQAARPTFHDSLAADAVLPVPERRGGRLRGRSLGRRAAGVVHRAERAGARGARRIGGRVAAAAGLDRRTALDVAVSRERKFSARRKSRLESNR